jgi:hypothetical protein
VYKSSSVSAQPRPARPDLVIVGKRAEGYHAPSGPRRSAGFVAAAVDVAGDDAHGLWVGRFDWVFVRGGSDDRGVCDDRKDMVVEVAGLFKRHRGGQVESQWRMDAVFNGVRTQCSRCQC